MGIWKAIKNKVKFWKNKWGGNFSLRDSFPDLYSTASSKDASVVDDWDGDSWDPRFIRQLNDWKLEEIDVFFRRLHNHSISLGTDDVMVWLETKNGEFSIKSFYCLASTRAKHFPYSIVLNSWAPIRANFFAWEAT